jgi:hypothetical protein
MYVVAKHICKKLNMPISLLTESASKLCNEILMQSDLHQRSMIVLYNIHAPAILC